MNLEIAVLQILRSFILRRREYIMKSKWMYVFLMLLGVGILSMNNVKAEKDSDTLKFCGHPSVDLRAAAVGFKCQTSKGVVYERVEKEKFGEAWKDLTTGYIWSDLIGEYTNDGVIKDCIVVNSPATRACANLGGILPERDIFFRGDDNGFREVLPNMDPWYWSSTVDPNFPFFAYVFNSSNGRGANSGLKVSYSVRCIGR